MIYIISTREIKAEINMKALEKNSTRGAKNPIVEVIGTKTGREVTKRNSDKMRRKNVNVLGGMDISRRCVITDEKGVMTVVRRDI